MGTEPIFPATHESVLKSCPPPKRIRGGEGQGPPPVKMSSPSLPFSIPAGAPKTPPSAPKLTIALPPPPPRKKRPHTAYPERSTFVYSGGILQELFSRAAGDCAAETRKRPRHPCCRCDDSDSE